MTSSSPTARTLAAETGLALSATLNRTLDCGSRREGEAGDARPRRDGQRGVNRPGTERDLVAARGGLFVGVRELATVSSGLLPTTPSVGRMGTSWYEGQPVPLRWVRLKPLIRLSA